MANCSNKTPMTFWSCISSSKYPSVPSLVFSHDMMPGSRLLSFFLVSGNTTMSQSILGVSSPYGGLVSQSTHLSTLFVVHNPSSDLTQDAFPSHSILITTFMDFIPISAKASSTGSPTVVITATDIYGSKAPFMMPFIPSFVELPINLISGIFSTGTGLSVLVIYFVNITTVRWYATSFSNTYCAVKDTSSNASYTKLSLHDSVALFYCVSVSHSHIILSIRHHITNWYYNN